MVSIGVLEMILSLSQTEIPYGEEDILDSFLKLKEKVTSKGVPVVIGECAAMRLRVRIDCKDDHNLNF